jgi:hypothetical protein
MGRTRRNQPTARMNRLVSRIQRVNDDNSSHSCTQRHQTSFREHIRERHARYHDTKRDETAFDHNQAASLGSRRTLCVITGHGRRLYAVSARARRVPRVFTHVESVSETGDDTRDDKLSVAIRRRL